MPLPPQENLAHWAPTVYSRHHRREGNSGVRTEPARRIGPRPQVSASHCTRASSREAVRYQGISFRKQPVLPVVELGDREYENQPWLQEFLPRTSTPLKPDIQIHAKSVQARTIGGCTRCP